MNLHPLLEGVEVIFHQAAQAGVRASWGQDFQRYTDRNILATQRLLEAALHIKTLQLTVYASSSSVYGNTNVLPIKETVTPHPVSPYGVTKLAAEHLCSLYYHNFGVPTVSLRYFTDTVRVKGRIRLSTVSVMPYSDIYQLYFGVTLILATLPILPISSKQISLPQPDKMRRSKS